MKASKKFAWKWMVGCFVILLFSHLAKAQLNLNTTIRPRTELRNGYRHLLTDNQKAAFFTSQRTRLGLDYQEDALEFKISVQDVRVWGNNAQLTEPPSMSLHEGYGAVMFSEKFSMRLGRQEWVYGEQRLLGSVNWAQQARSHDGLLLQYQGINGINADLGLAFNQENPRNSGTYFSRDDYKFLNFLWLEKSFDDASLAVVGIVDGHQINPVQNQEVVFRQTLGLNGSSVVNNFEVGGGFYYQTGEDPQQLPISAYMAHLNINYNISPVRITAGSDLISGNNGSNAGNQNREKNKAFNTLYATNHKFYGFMDYFLNIPNDTQQRGLNDNYLKVDLQTESNLSGGFHFHYFTLAKPLSYFDVDQGEEVEKNGLGAEIDLVLGYQFRENIQFNGGFSSMFASNTLDYLQGNNNVKNGQWAWVMVSINPSVQLWSSRDD